MLTTAQFADHFQVAYTTVMTWLARGIVPGAQKVEAPRGAVWEIPATALETFTPPEPGRPKKEEADIKPTKKAGKKSAKK